MKKNPLEAFGVSPALFEEIGYKLTSTQKRISVRDESVIGSQYDGEIAGVPLSWRNVKDGENGYFWTMGMVGPGWSLTCAMSMSPPRGASTKADYAKVKIYTSEGDRERYIFRPKFTGNIDKMKRHLALVRLFID